MRKNKIILLILYVLLIILINCSNNNPGNIEEQQYIPQPGMSVRDDRVVWTKKDDIPSPFLHDDGSVVNSPVEWETCRELIKKILEEYVYGPRPTLPIEHIETGKEYPDYFVSANAITYHAKIFYDNSRCFNIRVTRPSGNGRYPVIIRYENNEDFRFPIEKECIDNNRYVIVALNHLSVAPEEEQILENQMHESKVLMSWAYAASLTVDYLEMLDFADCSKIAVAGMSRTGKSAICAAVYDERIAIVVANSSGAAGASGFRNFGEKSTQAINIVRHQPTWVSEKLLEYIDNPDELPVDMHFARALIAPRVILTTEAYDGGGAKWAGPVSTFRIWEASDYAFELYGKTVNNLIHLRRGVHDQLKKDYERMMEVINHVFYGDSFESTSYRKNIYDYEFYRYGQY